MIKSALQAALFTTVRATGEAYFHKLPYIPTATVALTCAAIRYAFDYCARTNVASVEFNTSGYACLFNAVNGYLKSCITSDPVERASYLELSISLLPSV